MFAETLKRLRIKSGKSRYKFAQYSELSEPYILRLESGERANPSRDVVVRLGMALAHGVSSIEIWDMDALLLRCPPSKAFALRPYPTIGVHGP